MDTRFVKVLLVDDDEDDYIVTRDLLEDAQISDFELDWVSNYDLGVETIAKKEHQVYLLDYRLGQYTGLDILEKAVKMGCKEPFILLTGLGDHDIDQTAMKMGAADYLVKGQIDTPLLERSILHAIERKQAEAKQALLMEELKSANQELQDFAYIVSHDLKAPLRGISSLADWLNMDYIDQIDAQGQEMLQLIKQRSQRMNSLIDGILQYSRIGRLKEQQTEVDLNQIVAEVIDVLAIADNMKITIVNPLPTIQCQKTRIYQLFQNLLSNAVKYIDKPQGEINISCEKLVNCWRFEIADNGSGIEEKHFDKIFQLFQTLTPTDNAESTGVGLSLVKKIVEMHGGKIWLTSQLGLGTNFYFEIPQQSHNNPIIIENYRKKMI